MAIFRVGPSRPYTTINSAIIAAPGNDDLIVIDQGTYNEGVLIDKWVSLLANTQTPENGDVYIYSDYNNRPITISYLPAVNEAIYIEGLKLDRVAHTWDVLVYIINSNANLSIYLNRCWIGDGGSTVMYPIDPVNQPMNKFYIENCYIENGYSNIVYANWNNITEGVISKTETNGAYYCYLCTGSPDTLDTVDTPTVDYGPAYGSYYKSSDPPTVSGTADVMANILGLEWVSYPNMWTSGGYIFKSNPIGVHVYNSSTENLLGVISYVVGQQGSVWANDDYLYIGTVNSGVVRSPMSSISGAVYDDLAVYKNYPDIASSYINYLHGAGNYLCVATISGVHIFDLTTGSGVYSNTSISARKCHQLADRTSYYIYDDKALTIYNDDLTYMYQYGDGIIPTISDINDLHVVSGTNNLILLATKSGAIAIEERKGDEENSRFKYYYTEE